MSAAWSLIDTKTESMTQKILGSDETPFKNLQLPVGTGHSLTICTLRHLEGAASDLAREGRKTLPEAQSNTVCQRPESGANK